MNISSDEAAQALRDIETSKAAMRRAIRNHRGHVHLWLWGCVWILMAVLGWTGYARVHPLSFIWATAAGTVVSFVVGVSQSRQVRATFDKRFLAICAALLVFSYLVWPPLLGGYRMSFEGIYAYSSVIWMQLYVVGGIMFSRPLLYLGILVTALMMAGLLLVPALFWGACVLCGAALVGTGFIVRSTWE